MELGQGWDRGMDLVWGQGSNKPHPHRTPPTLHLDLSSSTHRLDSPVAKNVPDSSRSKSLLGLSFRSAARQGYRVHLLQGVGQDSERDWGVVGQDSERDLGLE